MIPDAPFHAHIYYTKEIRPAAAALRERLAAMGDHVCFAGSMTDRAVGPHPIPQFEVHFRSGSVAEVCEVIERSGLTALVHPLTDDDLADHTALARWIGEPLTLDLTVLDPPGRNKGLRRFGSTDF